MSPLESLPVAGGICSEINRYLATPKYIVILMLSAAVSGFLGAELILYTLVALLTVYVCVKGDDLLPLMPLPVCCYIAPSPMNNPGRNPNSLFALDRGGIYMLILAGIMAAALLYRVSRDRKQVLQCKYPLLSGFLLVLAAYLVSGIGAVHYREIAGKNLLFALLQGLSLLLPYVLFSGCVNWKKARKDYLPWIGCSTGCALLLQLLYIYITGDVIQEGIIIRTQIYTGWGMHNNIGGLLAMMIPFAFYLAGNYQRGWIGAVAGFAFYIGVLLTCSRTSIMIASVCCMVCVILLIYYARSPKTNAIVLIGLICFSSVTMLFFHQKILTLFSDLWDKGLDPSSRDIIYRKGMELFRTSPIVGTSFYSPGFEPWEWSTVAEFTDFFPPRWHSTVIQLLACCGTVGLVAYLIHRIQTLHMLFCNHSKEKNFVFCSIAVLLLCSLFDCHFFNIGPVLFYAMALAFAENCHQGN